MNAKAKRLAEADRFLSPQGLLDYRLAREGYADQIQHWLVGFYPTEDQFYALARALNGLPLDRGMTPEAAAAVSSALGAEMMARIVEMQGPAVRKACSVAASLKLSRGDTDALVDLAAHFKPGDAGYDGRLKNILKTPAAIGVFQHAFGPAGAPAPSPVNSFRERR